MYFALAQLCNSTWVLWCQVLYIQKSISGKGWSFQNCFSNLRAWVRFCLLKSLRLHKETFFSVSLSQYLRVCNVGEVPATAEVSRTRTVWQQTQTSESCSIYSACSSQVCCRERGCSCPTCMCMNSTSCWEGKSSWGDKNKGRWVRCGCWRDSGVWGDELYYWHTMVSWLMWGKIDFSVESFHCPGQTSVALNIVKTLLN